MNYAKIKVDNTEFIFIGKYEINSDEIYKFANQDKIIYCLKEKEQYIPIKDKRKLAEIKEFFKVDSDVLF